MLPDALVRLSRKLRVSPLADEHGVAAWHDKVEKTRLGFLPISPAGFES